MNISNYIKEHPYSSGFILVVGGIVFYLIVSGGSSAPSTQYVETGPSEAEIMAQATLGAAQIEANTIASQAAATVKAAEIGAGVQLKSSELEAAIAMASIGSAKDIAISQTEADKYIASLGYEGSKYVSDNEYKSTILSADLAKTVAGYTRDIELADIDSSKSMFETMQASNVTMAELSASTISSLTAASIARDSIARDVSISQTNASRDVLVNLQNNQTAIEIGNLAKDVELGRGILQVNAQGINAQKEVDLANIAAAENINTTYANAKRDTQIANINFASSSLPYLKKKNRDDVVQAVITGEQFKPNPKPSTIADIGTAAAGIGGAISSVVPFL